jgi:purine-binding chemotaxis protein CheW
MKAVCRAAGVEIDWQALHARLASTAAATRAATARSADCAEIVLEERARRLAQPLADDRVAKVTLDLLGFALSGERYGIETRYVQEVVRLGGITPVPGVADFVAGLANVRGQILVVFDIRPLLGLPTRDPTDASRIVVCGDAQPDLGLIVDCVGEVATLPEDDVLADTIPEGRSAQRLVRGIGRDAMIVLDGAALLADRRLFVDAPRA